MLRPASYWWLKRAAATPTCAAARSRWAVRICSPTTALSTTCSCGFSPRRLALRATTESPSIAAQGSGQRGGRRAWHERSCATGRETPDGAVPVDGPAAPERAAYSRTRTLLNQHDVGARAGLQAAAVGEPRCACGIQRNQLDRFVQREDLLHRQAVRGLDQ